MAPPPPDEPVPREPSDAPRPRRSGPDDSTQLWALAGVGLELVGAVGAMALLGWALDRWWGTAPWLLVSGALLGIIGGLYNLIKRAGRFL